MLSCSYKESNNPTRDQHEIKVVINPVQKQRIKRNQNKKFRNMEKNRFIRF